MNGAIAALEWIFARVSGAYVGGRLQVKNRISHTPTPFHSQPKPFAFISHAHATPTTMSKESTHRLFLAEYEELRQKGVEFGRLIGNYAESQNAYFGERSRTLTRHVQQKKNYPSIDTDAWRDTVQHELRRGEERYQGEVAADIRALKRGVSGLAAGCAGLEGIRAAAKQQGTWPSQLDAPMEAIIYEVKSKLREWAAVGNNFIWLESEFAVIVQRRLALDFGPVRVHRPSSDPRV